MSFQDECRRLLCANGALRTSTGCKLFTTTWYKYGYIIHVLLTPVSDDLLPKVAFEAISEKKKRNVKKWFDSKGIPVDNLVMYAEMVNKQNISYMRHLNIILGSERYPIAANETLKTIESAMLKQWSITVNKKIYLYHVNFDKYETYIQNGNIQRWNFFASQLTVALPEDILPKVYELVFSYAKIINFHINKLYFYEQVDLLDGEWIGDYQGLWLNLTGRENETFLGDAEFNSELGPDGKWNIQICVDDFINSGPAAKSLADRLVSRLYFIVFITNKI